MALVPQIKHGNWKSVQTAITKLASLKLGPRSTPTFQSLTLSKYAGLGGTLTVEGGITVDIEDAFNNAVTDVLNLKHSTTGTPAAGIGTGLVFEVEDAGGTEEQGSIDVLLTTVTDGSEDADMVFSLNKAGTITEMGRIDSSGSLFNITNLGIICTNITVSEICTIAAGLNVLRVTGLQTDGTAMTGTLRGAYIDVSNGSTAATGTIRGMELKARTEAPGDTGNDVAVLEGLSISADSKGHSVTTMRGAEFILDGSTGGTITEAVGLRIANNLQADKATTSYGLQIYRDSFDYTADIQLSSGGLIGGSTGHLRITSGGVILISSDVELIDNKGIEFGAGGLYNLDYDSKLYSDGTKTVLNIASPDGFQSYENPSLFFTYYNLIDLGIDYFIPCFSSTAKTFAMSNTLYVRDEDKAADGRIIVPAHDNDTEQLVLTYDTDNDYGKIYTVGTTKDIRIVPTGKLQIDVVTMANNKIAFTQTDLNEYIDSLADGYMDYGATTAHRFNNDITLSGTTTPTLTIESTDASDPTLIFKTTNTANQINIFLDESATNDNLRIDGQTAGVDTQVVIHAIDGERARLLLYSGGANYGYLMYGAADTLTLANTKEDEDIVLSIDDGGVTKTITWDADIDVLKHSASLFSFDDHFLINGTIKIKEQAAAEADTEAYGQLWVKTATPNQLWFTDDAGTDIRCAPQDLQTTASPTFANLLLAVNIGTAANGTMLQLVGANDQLVLNYSLYLTEMAVAFGDVDGKGQIWVKNTTPNELWFTDDTGVDVQLNTSNYGWYNINGTPTKVYTKYFTGTLDADASTSVAHGITGIDNILSVTVSLYNTATYYVVAETFLAANGNFGFSVIYDGTNITISNVVAAYQSQKYRIKIDYVV